MKVCPYIDWVKRVIVNIIYTSMTHHNLDWMMLVTFKYFHLDSLKP